METQTQSRKLRTCLWIVNQLRIHRDGQSLAELNEQFTRYEELSHGQPILKNTMLNYKAAILDMFGISIECSRSTRRYSIDLESNNDLADWLINSFSVGQLIREQTDVRERILLEETPQGMHLFPLLVESIREQKPLRMTYQKFADTAPYDCRLEPYALKLDDGRWYILGRKDDRSHLQSFAFDRIQALTLMEGERYEFSLPFDPQTHYKDSFGIFTSPAAEEVRIRVYGNTYNYLHTKPLHHSQQEQLLSSPSTPEEERVWLFTYHICPSPDFRNELLRWGAGVEVVSPASFREELKREAELMAARYER